MVEFKRKQGENFETFLRRFNKTLQRSRKLRLVRSQRFFAQDRNKNEQKEYALVSKKLRENKEYLKKTGKLKDEPKRRW